MSCCLLGTGIVDSAACLRDGDVEHAMGEVWCRQVNADVWPCDMFIAIA